MRVYLAGQNPTQIGRATASLERRDGSSVKCDAFDTCEAIGLMPDWEQSHAARIRFSQAVMLRLHILRCVDSHVGPPDVSEWFLSPVFPEHFPFPHHYAAQVGEVVVGRQARGAAEIVTDPSEDALARALVRLRDGGK